MRSSKVTGVAAVAVATALLGGCATLPASGPTTEQIDPPSVSNTAIKDYLLVDLNQRVVDVLSQYRAAPFSKRFAAPQPAPGQIVGVGDVLSVQLFEAGQGGLFSSDLGARVSLTQRVDSDGSITVPYAGRISAAGAGPQTVEKRIVAALEGRAIQPQALVQITETVSRSFVVNGEVGKPGRFPITAAGDRVLDAIATAGGAKNELFQTRVTLVRGSSQASAIMKTLVDNPADNVFVQPGDRVYLTKDPELFLAFGAVPQPGPIMFDLERISLLEAVGKAGGLMDQRSDPGALFVFRYEPASAARAIRPDYDGRFGERVPMVYRVNLRDPAAYFYAKAFVVRDKDVLYVANAKLSELQKFLQILATARNVAQTAQTVQRLSQQ
ncbi:sugar ABC transporter substrate-binding protein [Methylopila jiangsuensis]|uniref:Sugar ABC transporter substrate-binding protein n=1 Tax=Methylopila jiangsuensis TaxID=586230 RepID=A0A9W6JCQ4_9HYPH|nr:polysaccharide biosynthesis/export family protein [Methylopila jiangsuensis]MDR6287188.1 polysaccharide export outer membrane protein [Methylopila jiangsuensis]GLK74852.1 sugar ABC transporter substrate-binding protein [Methylopila jiangsuensis]